MRAPTRVVIFTKTAKIANALKSAKKLENSSSQ